MTDMVTRVAAAIHFCPDDADATTLAIAAIEAIPTALDGGRFDEWSTKELAAQCRMQGRHSLDPEYELFMSAVAKRLAALKENADG